MRSRLCVPVLLASAVAALALALAARAGPKADEKSPLRARWEMPVACDPFGEPRVKDLKDELRRTGYRLVVAMHPDRPPTKEGKYPPRDLYIVGADGSGLRQITSTPDFDETVPRTSPDGKRFTYNYGDFVVDARTLATRRADAGYTWMPDGRRTVSCEKRGIVYTDIDTGEQSKPVKVSRNVDIVSVTPDGKWFIFEIRKYLGQEYTIDFMSADGGEIRKMPNHPIKEGECHPSFSPDGRWMCWNAGESLSVRRFDPSLPDGTDGKITTLPKEKLGQDPCGRWSHCGRYIAFVRIPHSGTWRVHSPLCIVRVADGETVQISPPGMVGHHWDYDWLPSEE